MSDIWIRPLLVALAVVGSGAVLYLGLLFFVSRRRAVCPACGARALRCVAMIRATVLVDGKRAPASWSYFCCDACGARHRQNLGGEFTVPTAEEWAQDSAESR